MIHVHIIAVGKLKEPYLRDACAEYQKRLSAFCRLAVTEVAACPLPERPSDGEIRAALEKEGRLILQSVQKGAYLIPLCIEGKTLSSEELSGQLDSVALKGTSCITFVIGGSYGLSPEVKKAGDFPFSMSRLTFPHQLARVMLLEQVYRGFMLSNGGKYHK